MVSHLSKSIAAFFMKKNIIPEDEFDSYVYGYQIMLISIINWGTILAIMIITGKIYETLLYMLSIIMLRHHTGGYHARTHLRCFATSLVLYLFMLLIICTVENNIVPAISMLLMIVACSIIMKFAPIIHINNPVKAQSLKKHRLYSIFLSILFAILIIVFLFVKYYALALSVSLGIFQVSVFLLIEYFINNRKENV